MNPKILIITEYADWHAYAVTEALRRAGAKPILWYATDFPDLSRESIQFDSNKQRIQIIGPEMEIMNLCPDVVWNRRSSRFIVDETKLHPADRTFAKAQCQEFRRAILQLIAPDAFWVNSPIAAYHAEIKQIQHQTAVDTGLDMPPTLYSNDPQQIRAFIQSHGGTIVYKKLQPMHSIWHDGEKTRFAYTSFLTEADLPADDVLAAAPGIYQAVVRKAYELRITVIGQHIFPAKIFSQETTKGKLDFRMAYDELCIVPTDIPSVLTTAIRTFMNRLGLVFGCFDFIVTPDNRYIFLEVNQMGQFLFLERMAGIPLLDPFVEFLKQGREDFTWEATNVTVLLDDIHAAIESQIMQATSLHTALPSMIIYESEMQEKR